MEDYEVHVLGAPTRCNFCNAGSICPLWVAEHISEVETGFSDVLTRPKVCEAAVDDAIMHEVGVRSPLSQHCPPGCSPCTTDIVCAVEAHAKEDVQPMNTDNSVCHAEEIAMQPEHAI